MIIPQFEKEMGGVYPHFLHSMSTSTGWENEPIHLIFAQAIIAPGTRMLVVVIPVAKTLCILEHPFI
ncbi:MAG: hypothetical protein WAM09_11050 [Anaerolineales bacterium]